jgi:hypothetical protein
MKAGGEEVLEIQFIPYGKASVSECGMKWVPGFMSKDTVMERL